LSVFRGPSFEIASVGRAAHVLRVRDDDTLVVIASHLRSEEAGMLRGLLESAGILVTVRDDVLSSVHPFLSPIIGGAKLVVRAADEERAREIVQAAGVLRGSARDEPVDIPEEEWSRAPEERPAGEPAHSKPSWPRRVAIAAPFLILLTFVFLRCVAGAAP
jgi:hypothetical protein